MFSVIFYYRYLFLRKYNKMQQALYMVQKQSIQVTINSNSEPLIKKGVPEIKISAPLYATIVLQLQLVVFH